MLDDRSVLWWVTDVVVIAEVLTTSVDGDESSPSLTSAQLVQSQDSEQSRLRISIPSHQIALV